MRRRLVLQLHGLPVPELPGIPGRPLLALADPVGRCARQGTGGGRVKHPGRCRPRPALSLRVEKP